MVRTAALALLASTALMAAPCAEAQQKFNVQITANTPDATGQQLAFYLRDTIRKSGTFQETFDSSVATFLMVLSTLDPDENTQSAGFRTIYSIAIAGKNKDGFDYYFDSTVGFCGRDVLASCSQSLMARLGGDVEQLRTIAAQTTTRK